MSYATARKRGSNSEINKLYEEDRAVHEWYRFVLSYPPHLVRDYLHRFNADEFSLVLDPFCGTGTTLVEAKKLGVPSIGIEANTMAFYATKVKTDWSPSSHGLLDHARLVAQTVKSRLDAENIEDNVLFAHPVIVPERLHALPAESMDLLLAHSISPLPLHKALVLLEEIEAQHDERYYDHERLALAKAVVYSSSNLHFGPEIGVGTPKEDAPVISPWLANIRGMSNDLQSYNSLHSIPSQVFHADARQMTALMKQGYIHPNSVDIVITSPPYPNEKDYTRTTRLETVLLGFIKDKAQLQTMKRGLLRSNTRNVYKGDEDHLEILSPEIQRIAALIEAKRIELKKTSGFEKLYGRVTRLYFGGIAQHLAQLRFLLRPGAYLAYVVGDQASYLRVMIPTGQLIAEIGKALGYQLEGIDLFRTRLATATKEQLREEVVVLRWPKDAAKAEWYQMLPLNSPSEEEEYPMSEETENTIEASIVEDNEEENTEQTQKAKKGPSRYQQIMAKIFERHYKEGDTEVFFQREELTEVAQELGIKVVLNLGDVMYSFRYRQPLPESIRQTATEGQEWVIMSVGRSQYKFVLRKVSTILPNNLIGETRIPDATPGIVTMYAKGDEQSLLAKLRYNRLLDIFTGITCYSLQSHLRTFIPSVGQVETDEVYVGIDRFGAHYVFPVQAKGGRDKLGITQIEQDFALCEDKFNTEQITVRSIAAQFMSKEVIALMAFRKGRDQVEIVDEKHYRLVPPTQLSEEELIAYQQRLREAEAKY